MLPPIASKFGPQEVNRFVGSFELHATILSNRVKMALLSGGILSRVLRRMKACIDEFRPNTSQANYIEGFWRITSEINAKTVRIFGPSLAHILLKRSEIRPAGLFAFKSLAYFDE